LAFIREARSAGDDRVIHNDSNRFWARSSVSPKRYEPNVDELRRIFNEAPITAERIRAFRTDRLVKIAAQQAPVALVETYLLVLHVVPYSSVGIGTSLSVADLEKEWAIFPPLGRGRGHAVHRYVNFDGFIVLPDRRPQYHAYAQVFRSGIVEAVSTVNRSDGAVLASVLDKYCVASTKPYVDALTKFGIGFPVAALASLLAALIHDGVGSGLGVSAKPLI